MSKDKIDKLRTSLKAISNGYHLSNDGTRLDIKNVNPDQLKQLVQLLETDNLLKKIFCNDTNDTDSYGDGNYMNDACLQVLANGLKTNSNITELSIEYPGRLNAGGAGIDAVIELLGVSASLSELTLIQCLINDKQVIQLAKALAVNKTLTKLDLGFNAIGGYGAALIVNAIDKQGSVTDLSLDNVRLGVQLERFLQAVEQNHSLTRLSLNDNNIGEEGFVLLAKHLKNNLVLRELSILDDGFELQKKKAALDNLFKKNHWMDKIVFSKFSSPFERAAEEKALNGSGIETLGVFKKAVSEGNSDAVNVGLNLK